MGYEVMPNDDFFEVYMRFRPNIEWPWSDWILADWIGNGWFSLDDDGEAGQDWEVEYIDFNPVWRDPDDPDENPYLCDTSVTSFTWYIGGGPGP